jgi:hypothetical protein
VLAERAIAAAAASGDDLLQAEALTTLGAITGDVEVLEQGLSVARRIGANETIARMLFNKLWAIVDRTGRRDHAPAVLRELEDSLAAPMAAWWRARALCHGAVMSCQIGRFADASRLLDRVPDLDFTGSDGFFVLDCWFYVSLCRGEVARAEESLDRMRALARPDLLDAIFVAINVGQLAFARDEQVLVASSSDPTFDLAAALEAEDVRANYLLWVARSATTVSQACLSKGDAAGVAAARASGERVRAAIMSRPPTSSASAPAIDAELAMLFGEPDPDRFAAAATGFDEAGNVVDAGWCRVREVDAALAAGDHHRAETVASETHRVATELGYRLLTDLVASRAATTGMTIQNGVGDRQRP